MSDWTPKCGPSHYKGCDCTEMKHANDKIRLRNEILKINKECDELRSEVERLKSKNFERGDLWNSYEEVLKERDELKRKLSIAEKALDAYGECTPYHEYTQPQLKELSEIHTNNVVGRICKARLLAREALAAIRSDAEKVI